MRNAAVASRRLLEWIAGWPNVDLSRLDRLREVIKYLHWAVNRFDNQEILTMNFTISATGARDQVLEQLESQREDKADYASLKNQVIEHVAGYVQTAPEGSAGFSVSVSAQVSFTSPTGGEQPG
jgi:hypothetical protein